MNNSTRKKRGNTGRRLAKVALIAVGILCITGGYYHKELLRFYNVITLFNSGVIVDNFRSMETMFHTSPVRRGESVHGFERALCDLPVQYTYKGETKDLPTFLADTATTGLVVLKDGKIAFEEYYLGNTASSKTISWSMAKSFVSALIGIAIDERDIEDIEKTVTDYVPALKGSGYDGVRIKDVLQMSSGVRFNEDYGNPFSDINRMGWSIAFNTSLDRLVASLEREREPGTYNHYVSMDTQVLGMILREATKQTLSSYLEEKIWQKIGMESDAYWLTDSNGTELAFGGLNAVLRDYARFGQLYLEEGNYNGEQIIPVQWVHSSITPDAIHLQPGENPNSNSVLGYGYQWWIPQNPESDFLAIGLYNQFIYVHPEYRIVIAKSSAYPDYKKDGDEKELETIEVFRTIAKNLIKR